MMTRDLELSILSAPLAAIDRRTLSQAWYSALHVAQGNPAHSPPQACTPRVSDSLGHPIAEANKAVRLGDEAPPTPAPAGRRPGNNRATSAVNDCAGAQSGRSALSRRIERRFARNPAPIARATFSFGSGTARVHVIMQTNGNSARLVAICRPHMRDVVARALAEARLTLNSRSALLLNTGTVLKSSAPVVSSERLTQELSEDDTTVRRTAQCS